MGDEYWLRLTQIAYPWGRYEMIPPQQRPCRDQCVSTRVNGARYCEYALIKVQIFGNTP